MITIGEDKIAIEESSREITFSATGGQDDPIEVHLTGSQITITLYREDIEMFQMAFVNFLNTGWFDQEG